MITQENTECLDKDSLKGKEPCGCGMRNGFGNGCNSRRGIRYNKAIGITKAEERQILEKKLNELNLEKQEIEKRLSEIKCD